MNQPILEFDGNCYEVWSVSWYTSETNFRVGEVSSVSFYKDGETETAFYKNDWDKEGYNESGILHLDLEKRLKWSDQVEI